MIRAYNQPLFEDIAQRAQRQQFALLPLLLIHACERKLLCRLGSVCWRAGTSVGGPAVSACSCKLHVACLGCPASTNGVVWAGAAVVPCHMTAVWKQLLCLFWVVALVPPDVCYWGLSQSMYWGVQACGSCVRLIFTCCHWDSVLWWHWACSAPESPCIARAVKCC